MVTLITIVPNQLSDRSVTYDVRVSERESPDCVLFHTVSEVDAGAFASTLAKAIADHTVDGVRIRCAETVEG